MRERILEFLIENKVELELSGDFIQAISYAIDDDYVDINYQDIVHVLVTRNYVKALEALFGNSLELLLDAEFWQSTGNMGRTIGHEAVLLHNFPNYFILGNLPDSAHRLEMFNCLIKNSNYFSKEFWSLRDINGATLGHLAVKVDSIEIIKALQELLGIDYWRLTDNRGMTLVHTAVQHNRMNLFEFFVTNAEAFGFDKEFWSSITVEGYTLAHLAANNPSDNNLFLLLKRYRKLGLDNSFWQIKTIAGNTIAHELFTNNSDNYIADKFPKNASDEYGAVELFSPHKVRMLITLLRNSRMLGLNNQFWCAINDGGANIAHLAANMRARKALDVLAYMHNKLKLGSNFWYAQDNKGFSPISIILDLDLATDQLRQGFLTNAHYYFSVLFRLSKIFTSDKHLKYFGRFVSFEPLVIQYILSSELGIYSQAPNSFPNALITEINSYLCGSAVAYNTKRIYYDIISNVMPNVNWSLSISISLSSTQIEIGRAICKELQSYLSYDFELVDAIDDNLQSKFPIGISFLELDERLKYAENMYHRVAILSSLRSYVQSHSNSLLNRLSLEYVEAQGARNVRKRSENSEELQLNLFLTPGNKPQLQLNDQINSLFTRLIKALASSLPKSPQVPKGYVDVPGDGLCFFHAVAAQLSGKNLTAQQLQQMAIDEVLNHPDQYGGFAANGLEALLNYHLQRQESAKGGWADNIMMQALVNAIGYVVEVQLFDLQGNALEAAPVRIVPNNNLAKVRVLRLGNIDNLHFVAGAIDSDVKEEYEIAHHRMPQDSPLSDGGNSTLQEYQPIELAGGIVAASAEAITSFTEEHKDYLFY